MSVERAGSGHHLQELEVRPRELSSTDVAEQLLSTLTTTAHVNAPVQDALSASEEHQAAFSASMQQTCSQVLGPTSGAFLLQKCHY